MKSSNTVLSVREAVDKMLFLECILLWNKRVYKLN